jgi:hypothetical protein
MSFVLNVKNIPAKPGTNFDLKEIFKCDKGNVTNVKIVDKYGFVTFDSQEALDYWLEKKYIKCEDGTILDLGIGEKNKTLHIWLKNNSQKKIKDIIIDLKLVPILSLETSIDGKNKNEDNNDEKNREMIITFENRLVAEDAEEYLRDNHNSCIEMRWVDRDSYPISIHISFNQSVDINVFNKEILEEHLYSLQDEENDDVEKKENEKSEKKKEKIKIFVDLPREKGHYRGYGTIQYDKTYSGMKECKRIIEKHPLIKIKTVTIKLAPHHRFNRTTSTSPSSTSISPTVSYPSIPLPTIQQLLLYRHLCYMSSSFPPTRMIVNQLPLQYFIPPPQQQQQQSKPAAGLSQNNIISKETQDNIFHVKNISNLSPSAEPFIPREQIYGDNAILSGWSSSVPLGLPPGLNKDEDNDDNFNTNESLFNQHNTLFFY